MRRRLIVFTVAAVAVVASALPAIAGPVPEGPVGDAFYTPPDPLPKSKPGTLIQAQPIDGPDGANAWRVLYHSRSLAGDDIAVSGVIVAPTAPAPPEGRPILSWGHGGAGIDDQCAPSRQFADPGLLVPFMKDYLAAGFVVVASDYEGLGTPGDAPFLVGESEGRSLLDIARAARRLDGTGAGTQVVVAGQSEGGHASLFAGEIAPKYAPELELLGVIAGAPPANLEVLAPLALQTPPTLGYGMLMLVGASTAYPKARLDAVLTPEAVAQADLARTGCTGLVLAVFAPTPLPVTKKDPTAVKPWARALHKMSAGNRVIDAPMLVFQGDVDRIIPMSSTDDYVAAACALGDTLAYRVYRGFGHPDVVGAAKADILAFATSVVAGDEPTSTC